MRNYISQNFEYAFGQHSGVIDVNKNKFDPIVPPANPLQLISPQKYAKERITHSFIKFNNRIYK